jgi:hypothetical protein
MIIFIHPFSSYTSHRFGRTAFIVFIGSIVIAGKWWANILVGLFTFFVGGINCCVICDHPAFRKGGKMATWGQDEVDAEIGGGGEPYAICSGKVCAVGICAKPLPPCAPPPATALARPPPPAAAAA